MPTLATVTVGPNAAHTRRRFYASMDAYSRTQGRGQSRQSSRAQEHIANAVQCSLVSSPPVLPVSRKPVDVSCKGWTRVVWLQQVH